MSVRFLVRALAAGIFAAGSTAQADNAKPRSGGSSSSSAGAQHHSGSSGSAQSSGSSHGSSGSSGGDHGGAPPSSGGGSVAERRHPRAGTGTGDWPHHGHYYPGYYPGWYYPYWPSYYYGLYYSGGWGPYYGAGGYAGGPAYYTYRSGGDSAAVRVLVDPEKTKVYVDGYYAGVADDFDGMFQRLYLAPGRHEITLKFDGYRTHRMIVFVTPGQTLKIERDLEKGPGDETFEDLSGGRGAREETTDRPPDRDYGQPPDRDYGQPPDRGYGQPPDIGYGQPPNRGYEPAPAPRGGDQPYRPDSGRVRLDVRPPDASVYVDGQFQGPAGEMGELILAPGPHRVEVVRPGFRTEERDVQVEPRSTRTLTIELSRP